MDDLRSGFTRVGRAPRGGSSVVDVDEDFQASYSKEAGQ